MTLPEEDVKFLDGLGLKWKLEPEPNGDPDSPSGFVVIEDFDVSGGGFTPGKTNLLIRIPALYNQTPLDMWFCQPYLTRGGGAPPQTEGRLSVLGRTWQQFSRHLEPGTWIPGRDGLRSFFTFIFREMQGKV